MAAVGLAVALAACAAPEPGTAAPSSSTATTPTTDHRLVLQVRVVGGFLPVGYDVARVPSVTVYADGRVVGEGPEPAVAPGPAAPDLVERRITTAQVRDLVSRAIAAGVLERTDLGTPGVTDVPTTRITLATADGTAVRDVYALFEAGARSRGLTPEQAAARARLAAFVADLTTGAEAPGAGPAGAWSPYTPDRVAAVSRPYAGTDPSRPDPGTVPWPRPPLTGPEVLPGSTCTVASGDDAAAVLAAARTASVATRWTTPDGRAWQVLLRPLLPSETGCADLATG